MIIECPECGAKNQTSQPPQPSKRYRCGKCGATITFLQTTDTQDTLAEIPKEKTRPEEREEAKKGKISMKRIGIGVGCGFIAIIVIGNILIGLLTSGDETIDYQVLREWKIPAGGRGIGMELLVSETATKEEVLALATHLRSKYLSRGAINIEIWDSHEAYIESRVYEQDPDRYSEKEMEEIFKHILVWIQRNPHTGWDEIKWDWLGVRGD